MELKTDKRFWNFVADNATAKPEAQRLKYHKTPEVDGIDYALAITQIECRQKFQSKLSDTLQQYPHFIFPTRLAGEQSTSDLLAAWHAQLYGEADSLIDFTSGLGIDVLHAAKTVGKVTAIEQVPSLAEALQQNAAEMGFTNVTVMCGDCRELLEQGKLPLADVGFIDPARRAQDGSRIFAVSDCNPDVVAMLPELHKTVKRMIIKLSPMLDVTAVKMQLGANVTDIYVLGTRTECKELVVKMDFSKVTDSFTIHAVTIMPDGTTSELESGNKNEQTNDFRYKRPQPDSYIYEPYPSVMKVGLWYELGHKSPELYKMSDNTHVFWSSEKISDFPGKVYRLVQIIPWMSKHLKRLHNTYPRAEVAVRNFGLTAQALQKKLQISDGGNVRILGVTDAGNDKMLLVMQAE